MPIWKLTPRLANSPDWDLSTFRGDVLIRARDESAARDIATRAFAIAAKVKEDRSTRSNPWTNHDLVSCEVVHTHGYGDSGPSEVLSPKVDDNAGRATS